MSCGIRVLLHRVVSLHAYEPNASANLPAHLTGHDAGAIDVRLISEAGPYPCQVFRRVYSNGIELRLDNLDSNPMFERAQLLERFRPLHRGRWKRREGHQTLAAVDIQP